MVWYMECWYYYNIIVPPESKENPTFGIPLACWSCLSCLISFSLKWINSASLSQCSGFQMHSLSCPGLLANYHSRSPPFNKSGLFLFCSSAETLLSQSWHCVKSLPLIYNNEAYSGRAEPSFSEKTHEKNKLGTSEENTAGHCFTDHLHFFHLENQWKVICEIPDVAL